MKGTRIVAKASCESIDPGGLLGPNVRCDLPAGHEGRHRAKRSSPDKWVSEVFWEHTPEDDELTALRKVARAAGAYLAHSELRQSMHWPKKLELHNALAAWRNLKAMPSPSVPEEKL